MSKLISGSLKGCAMAAQTSEKSILLLKKVGGLVLLVCGVVLAALAYEDGSTGRAILGVLLAAAGIMLMVLKIVRRNTSGPL
jgi:drug/metabolite transporter (DMT)-like permease